MSKNHSEKALTHELDLAAYSLDDILGLFDLSRRTLSTAGLRRAKRQVLMLHPDKSGLDKDYFLFYKRALDVVNEFHAESSRMNRNVPCVPLEYDAETAHANEAASNAAGVRDAISRISPREFSANFNRAFEANAPRPVRDLTRNAWFESTSPTELADAAPRATAPAALGAAFDELRVRASAMVRHTGVSTLRSGAGVAVGNLYDGDDDEDGESIYVSSDPFSKLKYDDLRKVHKDQTVLPVGERDFARVQTFVSVDAYSRARGPVPEPMNTHDAETELGRAATIRRDWLMTKEYEAKKRTAEFEAKNSRVLSSFLQIANER